MMIFHNGDFNPISKEELLENFESLSKNLRFCGLTYRGYIKGNTIVICPDSIKAPFQIPFDGPSDLIQALEKWEKRVPSPIV